MHQDSFGICTSKLLSCYIGKTFIRELSFLGTFCTLFLSVDFPHFSYLLHPMLHDLDLLPEFSSSPIELLVVLGKLTPFGGLRIVPLFPNLLIDFGISHLSLIDLKSGVEVIIEDLNVDMAHLQVEWAPNRSSPPVRRLFSNWVLPNCPNPCFRGSKSSGNWKWTDRSVGEEAMERF